MMRLLLLVAALTAVSEGIIPEIVNSGVVLEDHQEPDRGFVEVEQLAENPQQKTEDDDDGGDAASHQSEKESISVSPGPSNLTPGQLNQTASGNDSVHTEQEVTTAGFQNVTAAVQSNELENDIHQGCSADGDCGNGRYCLQDTLSSKCLPCKAIDVSCSKDSECCGGQLCVWGQCSVNATKGEAGSTCQLQTDCSPELCCLFHKALLFPVCSAKPIERERCFGASNHLLELLSWDIQDHGPRKHCPCAGDLHCQHLGRGSMCLKGEDSSEEDMTDNLYSEIDYII